jgi:hypothetical protein
MMRLVSDCEALELVEKHLSDLERRFQDSDNPTRDINNAKLLEYCWILQQTQQLLASKHTVTTEDAARFVQHTQNILVVPDILQIVNLVPRSAVELHTILGDRVPMEQQEHILKLVQDILVHRK